jgi:branched-chain amino acid aminotransferase
MRIDVDSRFTPDPTRRESILKQELGFGLYFTDRMFTARYEEGRGWHDARIGPLTDLHLHPAAAVFHYGQAIFEGQKAYRRVDGEIGLFRPEQNARRFRRSAERMAMPPLPEELYLEAVETLVDLERDWVPWGEMQSLYIRPFMIATEPLQGVRAAKQYLFAVILSPVGAYYASGFKPVDILVSVNFVRAAEGGTGEAKAAGNYGASLVAAREAHDEGCAQVLWLDAKERRYTEEIGAMNVMFVIDGTLTTPPLTGTILPGVTRSCVLEIARDEGIAVEERPLTIDELTAAIGEGRCQESFGCGTAAVITAIRSFRYRGTTYCIRDEPGPVARKMFETITDIQWGRVSDPYGWARVVRRADARRSGGRIGTDPVGTR